MVIFSKTTCPYCPKAKNALTNEGYAGAKIYELDTMANGGEILRVLGRLTGAATVPRVFVGGDFIGGGDDTAAKQRSGALKLLLKAQGLVA